MPFKKVFLILSIFLLSCDKKEGVYPTSEENSNPGLARIESSNCKLPEKFVRGDVGLGFPRIPYKVKSMGKVKVQVLFVDFPDAPSSQTPQKVMGMITPNAESNFNISSNGKLQIEFHPHYKWLRMSKRSDQYGWKDLTNLLHKQYITEAIRLADPEINFSSTDALIIIANPEAEAIWNGPTFNALPGNGITADGKDIMTVATSGASIKREAGIWFNHEFGHMMTLVDLYAYSGVTHRFVGEFGLMGMMTGSGKDLFGWEKWLLGWLEDDQIVCVNSGTNRVTLTPVETKDGLKLFIIPVSSTSAIVVESRRSIGLDQNLVKTGPLVYLVDTEIPSGKGTIKVLPINDSDTRKLNAVLSVGQEISYLNYSIKYVSRKAEGDVIDISKK